MAAGSSGGTDDFEALIRQYWDSWGGSPHAGAAPAGVGAGGPMPWQEGIEKWSQLLGAGTTSGVDDVVQRFRQQGGDWLGTMQQVAAQFAGRDTSSAEVAAAWREAVGAKGDGMLRWMLDAARGGNAFTDQPWIREFAQRAQSGFSNAGPWLDAPTFGPAREYQARWQALLKIQQQYQSRAEAYVEQIRAVLDDAFDLFEVRLSEHESPGSQLTSARALFDLWIDAAEEAYAKVALSEQFREIYAELANAQMRLRAATQHELEKACETMGVPTRSEMDIAHRKIAELERMVRRLAAAAAPVRKAPPEAKTSTVGKRTTAKAAAGTAQAASPRPRKRRPAGREPQ